MAVGEQCCVNEVPAVFSSQTVLRYTVGMSTTTVDTPNPTAPVDPAEISKLFIQCNPGLTDFGSGNILGMASQCLRSANTPTECSRCLDSCPASALAAEEHNRPHSTTSCLKCGYCVPVCPTNALAATTTSLQQMTRLLLQATLRVDELTITCQRTLGLLRVLAKSADPEPAATDLAALSQAQSTENLYVVPCLAMLQCEMWFAVLNEIGVSRLQRLSVLLPPEQCALCPVNARDQIDQALAATIDSAEQWSGQTVRLLTQCRDVPQYHKANVREYLTSGREVERRGVFTGFVEELKLSYADSLRIGNRAADETQKIRARAATRQSTLLADDLKTNLTGSEKPILAPLRQILIEAIGRNPRHAERIRLLVSSTDTSRCNHCGQCISACPLRARRTEDGEVYSDPLYCLGCGACIQVCPQQACDYAWITGQAFLRDDQ